MDLDSRVDRVETLRNLHIGIHVNLHFTYKNRTLTYSELLHTLHDEDLLDESERDYLLKMMNLSLNNAHDTYIEEIVDAFQEAWDWMGQEVEE